MRTTQLLRTLNAVLFLSSGLLLSQSSSQSDVYQSQARLKTSTRLVVVDVVATDSKGDPVPNLTADDFTVLENGVPQKISNFSFQHSGQVTPAIMPQLPANVVTNAPPFASGVLDVILFASVNGEFSAQAYAKDQLVKFFSTAKLERPVALFAMESRIRMLHDFTTDAAALKTAIEKYRQTAQGGNTESFESRESPFATKGDYHTSERNIETTLNQLNALAKVRAGVSSMTGSFHSNVRCGVLPTSLTTSLKEPRFAAKIGLP